ncbi:DMT family transporter [Candidatus Chlamydia sanziniae]|uniref:Cationic Amino Acid Transporter n=1 Tax=Candidatus Chlamydia sanziniae TaxID=1806891 RepID=A0A1A9HV95_9CHLA|nr:DMT family transporter [Candidatus Chlamydia sanziniae]ANH78909.1 Cationic Amino Acid Transporter [Candidatus Chlamydia sanziniae]
MFPNTSQKPKARSLLTGIFYSLIACFYWAIVFVIPNLLKSFKELDIVLVRYTIFGLFSLICCIGKMPSLLKKTPLYIWKKSILWTLLVNPIYYFGITLGIRYIGAAMTVMIAGLSPVAILYYSNIKQKELSYSILFAISCIIIAGVVLTHISTFHLSMTTSLWQYILGIGAVTLSTILWVAYVICNQALLEKHPSLAPDAWCYLLGISALIICLPLIILFDILGLTHITQNLISHNPISERFLFISLCAIMGVFSSAKAITAWNKASLYLSSALLGTMLIFEPLFGLVFSYLYAQNLPSIQESLGIFLMLGGSLLSLVLFGRKASSTSPEEVS